uniref:Uncharacterized protein n=1 Tax=Ciona savignyi TaxID=51511 RepID=H2YC33_CIOSA
SNGSDVQSSLIRLITAENPPKPVKSPSRLLRQRSSPKRIRPLQHGRIEPTTRSLY